MSASTLTPVISTSLRHFAEGPQACHRSSSPEVIATCPALGAFFNPLFAITARAGGAIA